MNVIESNDSNRTIFVDSNENNSKNLTSSSSRLDIIVANNASFAVHWKIMCGCASASVDVDKDG
jgi:hypothetical protein